MVPKTSFGALAFFALVATTVAQSGEAWVGKRGPTGTGPLIEARAINTHMARQFQRIYADEGIVFRYIGPLIPYSRGHDPTNCQHTIGVQLIARYTFCGLYLLGFGMDNEGTVHMSLRFRGMNGSDWEYRLETAIYEKKDENEDQEENQGEEEPQFTFLQSNWYQDFGLDCTIGGIIPVYFQWLEVLLRYKLQSTTDPFPIDFPSYDADDSDILDEEPQCECYETRSVLLPADAMEKLRSTLRQWPPFDGPPPY